MDAFTTVIFLRRGGTEANPLIRLALSQSVQPAWGLIAPKLFAIGLAVYAWRSGRKEILLKMDYLFAACVAWNLIVIYVQH